MYLCWIIDEPQRFLPLKTMNKQISISNINGWYPIWKSFHRNREDKAIIDKP